MGSIAALVGYRGFTSGSGVKSIGTVDILNRVCGECTRLELLFIAVGFPESALEMVEEISSPSDLKRLSNCPTADVGTYICVIMVVILLNHSRVPYNAYTPMMRWRTSAEVSASDER